MQVHPDAGRDYFAIQSCNACRLQIIGDVPIPTAVCLDEAFSNKLAWMNVQRFSGQIGGDGILADDRASVNLAKYRCKYFPSRERPSSNPVPGRCSDVCNSLRRFLLYCRETW